MLETFSLRYNLHDHPTYLQQLLDAGLRVTVKGLWKDSEKDVFQRLGFPVTLMKEESHLLG